MKGLRFGIAIPAAFLAAGVAMRLLLPYAPVRFALDLAQPIPVVTNWNAFGATVLGVFMVGLALATAAYARLRRLAASSADVGSPFAVAAMVALSLACAWWVPVSFSSDVYAYAAYGELARLGADPYAHALLPSGNPIFQAAVVQWGNPPPTCVYGPVFVWIAATIVGLAAPFGTAFALDGLRVLSSAGLLFCSVLAYAAYRGGRPERLIAAATIGLNPVVLWCAAEGHNDTLALAVALAGFACARRGFAGAGAFVAACSGAIKLPGIVAVLPLIFANRRAWLGAAAGILVTLALSVPIFTGVTAHLAPHARYAPEASFQAVLYSLARSILSDREAASRLTWIAAIAASTGCALAAIAMLRRRASEGWTYLAAAGWLLVPNPYPWYAVWLVAIAAAAPGTRGAGVLLALGFTSVLRYLPDAVGAPGQAGSLLLGVAATLPLLWLLGRRKPSGIINGSA
jgi:hypothetical protein